MAKSLRPAAQLLKVAGPDFSGLLQPFEALDHGPQSLAQRHDELADTLREQARPVLVVLDDIDRLHGDELVLVLKLVRLVGRLPFVHYLLAYDHDTVIDVLAQTPVTGNTKERAGAYLEKMVQVRFDLPPLHTSHITSLMSEHMLDLISAFAIPPDRVDNQRFAQSHFWPLIYRHLGQPRAVLRFFAHVEGVLPLVIGDSTDGILEANLVDLLVITFYRLYFPGMYAQLPYLKADLAPEDLQRTPPGGTTGPAEVDKHRTAWLDQLEAFGVADRDQSVLLDSLADLFPHLGSRLGKKVPATTFDRLTADKRVGAAEYFDRYFHLGIVGTDISDADVHQGVTDTINGNTDTPATVRFWTHMSVYPDRVMWKVIRELDQKPGTWQGRFHFLCRLHGEYPNRTGTLSIERNIVLQRAAAELRAAPVVEGKQAVGEIHYTRVLWGTLIDIATLARATTDDPETIFPEEIKRILTVHATDVAWKQLNSLAVEPPDPANNPVLVAESLHDLGVDRATIQDWMWANIDNPDREWTLDDILGLTLVPAYGKVLHHGLDRPTLQTVDVVLGLDRVYARLGDIDPTTRPSDGSSTDLSLPNRTLWAKSFLPNRLGVDPLERQQHDETT